MSPPPVVTFLSDYGLDDEFVGVCHGVIVSRCPGAQVIDVTHGVRRHDVRGGALALQAALRYLPVGVHLAVVDPGVGGERRALAARAADGRLFVGPDNGLLHPAAVAAGGIVEAADIGASQYRIEPVSATFHGRDLFAPVAAHLAAGVPLGEVGEPYDPDEVVSIELSEARVLDGALLTSALAVDRFGNVELDAGPDALAQTGLAVGASAWIELRGDGVAAQLVRTFADARGDELLLYLNSTAHLTVALNQGDAAAALGIEPGDELRITPA